MKAKATLLYNVGNPLINGTVIGRKIEIIIHTGSRGIGTREGAHTISLIDRVGTYRSIRVDYKVNGKVVDRKKEIGRR